MTFMIAPLFANLGGSGPWTITVPSGALSSNVTSFPVYIDLADMPGSFWSSVASDGGNIRIKQSGSIIPFDVVTISTGGHTGRIFFKADLLSASNNVFTLDLTGGALLATNDTNGRNNVWTRFNRVYDGATNADRTGNGAALTLVGNAAFTSGQIVFDGADDFAYVPCSTGASDFTIFVVGHFDGDIPAGQHHVIASYATAGTGSPAFRNSLLIRDTGHWAVWNNTDLWLESGTAVSLNTDFTAANYHDSPGVKRAVWLNGVELTSTGSAATVSGSTPHFTLGGEDDTPATEFQGKLDLATYATEALPSAYLAGLHKNRRDRGNFYTIT